MLQAVNRRGLTVAFSDDDLAFLEALSGSVAVAIDNARAIEERGALRALRREVEIASEIQLSILPRRFPAFPERRTSISTPRCFRRTTLAGTSTTSS